jgi:Rrf2 family transcriptional repressor of oqxAB
LVAGDRKLWATRHEIPHEGLLGENISDLSEYLCDRAEQAVVDLLGSVTIEDSVAELRRLDMQKHGLSSGETDIEERHDAAE